MKGARRGAVTLGGLRAQAAAVGGDVSELLGHEIAGHGGDEEDQQKTDEDQHGWWEGGTESRAEPGRVLPIMGKTLTIPAEWLL
ncbi:hypothetical protein Ate02nite_11890 [Paractinoplanes tereljensis]|uniref:Uncharacterized protein n=1 Tax=Paractinoplanes tereljensis TaxID=571912 RepID=A0A919NH09_9ACTN|nr:hypothetical protein Ate02nite_11890 [Actinoplanes tereljensis]